MAYFKTLVVAGTNPTVQSFTTGSGTYTTPSGVQWIEVEAVGGGGGGGGSGSTTGNAGAAGSATTFGSSLITCNGAAAMSNAVTGGAGGSATATGLFGDILTGGSGQGGDTLAAGNTDFHAGGDGATSSLGGGGGGGPGGTAGTAGTTNSGSGGGGGGGVPSLALQVGGGGGAGGYVRVYILNPSATYSYTVGTGGAGGAAGTSGLAGGAGSAGKIIVREHYTDLGVGTSTAATANTVLAGPASGSAANPTLRALVAADLPIAVAATYGSSDSFSLTSSVILKFNSLKLDTDSAYSTSTGLFTIPAGKGGKYRMSWVVYSTTVTDFATQGFNMRLRKNSVMIVLGTCSLSAATNQIKSELPGYVFSAADGDTVDIFIDTTHSAGTVLADDTVSWFSIERIGS